MSTKIEVICDTCKKVFIKNKYDVKYKKCYCSNKCHYIGNSRDMTAEGNHRWVGDKVGYEGVHTWIKRRLPKPKRCENCREIKKLDLSNRGGKYLRRLNDWDWLCRKCHMEKDGRLNKLINRNKTIEEIKNYVR